MHLHRSYRSILDAKIMSPRHRKGNSQNIVKSLLFKNLNRKLKNQYERDDFILAELKKIQVGNLLLDACCGSQRYRK